MSERIKMQIGILANTKKEGRQIIEEIYSSSDNNVVIKSKDYIIDGEDIYKTITPQTIRGLKFDQLLVTEDFKDLRDFLVNATPIREKFMKFYLLLFDSEIPDEFKVMVWGD